MPRRHLARAKGETRSAEAPRAPVGPKVQFVQLDANVRTKALGPGKANTIIYVHGINNKPPASVLKCQWDTALFGTRLGDRSRMAYWVNREFYPTPLDETCAAGDVVNVDDDEASTQAIMALARGEPGSEERALDYELKALATEPARREWLRRVATKLIDGTAVKDTEKNVWRRLRPRFCSFFRSSCAG